MGVKIAHEKGGEPPIPFLKRAIELDPNFPMAYASLAVTYGNLNQPSLALESATTSYQLRDWVSEREKLLISAIYLGANSASALTQHVCSPSASTFMLRRANPEEL
jgi:hypothetical protein